jgi:alanine racemase
MGYVDPRDIPRNRHFIYAVSTLEYALELVKNYSKVRLHLFLDTGMCREGLQLNKKEEIRKNKEGLVMSPPVKGGAVGGGLYNIVSNIE